ncbi:MAG: 23S rRNA (uracil-5-)-methyltransferase RumA, partial [Lachnospiraceae bacterium]|nr:23S rRNA (uracil-5-)-methyltransferase RumA [Lachnospiraceae bacterium]
MKKGTIIEGMVERVKYPNKGVVMTQEGPVTVKNVLPDQKVRCSVTKASRDRMEGRLLEVIERSPLETGKVCEHFGVCGGCTYLSLGYDAQKAIKEEQVKSGLDRALEGQS